MNAKTHEAIKTHGKNLLAIFPDAAEKDPVALCKKLRRIETAANRLATDYCNGAVDVDAWGNGASRFLDRARKLLYPDSYRLEVSVNGDPRGHALKIDADWMRANQGNPAVARLRRDWGGYGLIAPDLTA